MTQPTRRLGIIGTAGRQADGPRMSLSVYQRMLVIAREVLATTHCDALVSGAAAWADHIAVALVIAGDLPAASLRLHLPAEFAHGKFSETTRDGGIGNYYHRLFRDKTGIDSLGQIATVITSGADCTVRPGFFARNGLVARDSRDALLAFTFGLGEPWHPVIHGNVTARTAGLKDGGTAHTFDRCASPMKIHVALE